MNSRPYSTAYFIAAHCYPQQIARLVDATYHPENHYLIHYDSKRPDDEALELESLLRERRNVEFLPRQPIYGGHWSMCDIELKAIAKLLRHDWSHVVNLSGQCFPLASESRTRQELDQLIGRSCVLTFDPVAVWGSATVSYRYGCLQLGPDGRSFRPSDREEDFKLWGNSQWKILARPAAQYLTESDTARQLQELFKPTVVPDESFPATALMNSHLANSVDPRYRHEVFWVGPIQPKVLTIADIDVLKHSSMLFARKFDSTIDNAILEALERCIRNN